MRVSMIEIILDARKEDVENALKNSEYVEDYEIDELDNEDIRKSVLIVFRELVDSRYIHDVLKNIFSFEEIKKIIDEE